MVPALREAARRRGVDLDGIVRRMREVLAEVDETLLRQPDAMDEATVDDIGMNYGLVEVVFEELESRAPEGLRARAYFTVEGFQIQRFGPKPRELWLGNTRFLI